MRGKIWISGLVTILGVLVMAWASGFAVESSSGLERIETFGVVSSTNPDDGTITITVDKASKDLRDKFGEDVTFHAASSARIEACSAQSNEISVCWNQLSESSGTPAREAERGAGKVDLSSLKSGDWVFISGNVDKKTNRFVADEILQWR